MSLLGTARRIARDTAARQGLPERVEDPATLGRISSLMTLGGAAEESKKKPTSTQNVGLRLEKKHDQHTSTGGTG